MTDLQIALSIEAATIEAVKEKRDYTCVGFEPDGELVAFLVTPYGSFWKTF
jgi:hypothetical protein